MTLFTYHMLHTPLFHILFPLLARNPAYAFVLSQANPDSTLATPLPTSFSRTHSSQPYISRIHSAFSCLGSVPPLDGRIRARTRPRERRSLVHRFTSFVPPQIVGQKQAQPCSTSHVRSEGGESISKSGEKETPHEGKRPNTSKSKAPFPRATLRTLRSSSPNPSPLPSFPSFPSSLPLGAFLSVSTMSFLPSSSSRAAPSVASVVSQRAYTRPVTVFAPFAALHPPSRQGTFPFSLLYSVAQTELLGVER